MDRRLSPGTPRPTLYQQLLGAAFFNLPPSLRRLHGERAGARYVGIVQVERGANPLARLCARVAGLPPAMQEAKLAVEFVPGPRGETWRREFAGHRLHTRLVGKRGLLRERLGLLHFRYRLHAREDAIWWQVVGVRLLGLLPLPAGWFERVRCREYQQDDGRYAFEVEAALPLLGRVVRYAGWLDRA